MLCCAVQPIPQVQHSDLLEQVQQLEVLPKENGAMAVLVAQLQVLKNDQQHMQELCDQVDRLRADNASLQRRSQTLPSLQAENERLAVSGVCAGEFGFVRQACMDGTHRHIPAQAAAVLQRSGRLRSCHRRPLLSWSVNLPARLIPLLRTVHVQASLSGVEAVEQQNQHLQAEVARVEELQAQVRRCLAHVFGAALTFCKTCCC